jgi:hypothetical protein
LRLEKSVHSIPFVDILGVTARLASFCLGWYSALVEDNGKPAKVGRLARNSFQLSF